MQILIKFIENTCTELLIIKIRFNSSLVLTNDKINVINISGNAN